MIQTIPKTQVWSGVYEKIREREYLINRRALLGLLRWDEVVHTDRIDSELTLEIVMKKPPDKVMINDVEYVPKKLLKTKI